MYQFINTYVSIITNKLLHFGEIDMAEDFIEEIYSQSEIIFEVKKAIAYCRKQQPFLFHKKWAVMQQQIADFCKNALSFDVEFGTYIWNQFLEITKDSENHDYDLAADKLEELIPYLYKAISFLGEIDVTEEPYRLFSTKSGYLGIQNIKTGKFLNSTIDPAWEAYEKSSELCIPSINKFCTLGCNLGYLSWQMYELSCQSIDIYIYDINETMYNYAIHYGLLSKIPKENVHLVIEPNISFLVSKFLDNYESFLDNKTALFIEDNTFQQLNEYKDTLQNIYDTLKSRGNMSSMCLRNFYRNISAVNKYISDYKVKKDTDKYIIIGGGPSLDYCIEYIKQNINDKIIIAATTVYAKLLNEGIKPDVIVCSDPQNRTYGHMSNVTDMSVPLLMDAMCNWQFGEKYKGDRYIIPCGVYYFTKEYYKTLNIDPWIPRGTVVGTSIDVAAFFGAKEIELIGVDLSYPEKHTHAKGTMDDKEIDYNGMIEVPSVNGHKVYTLGNFKCYIQGIEQQIKKYNNIKFFNLSKYGALIIGANHRSI